MAATKILNVHGAVTSPATMRVMAAIFEKNLRHKFIPVDMSQDEHKSDAFRALNPFGQIPVLEDGDFKLFESRAITHYLAHEYASQGTQLVSEDPKEKAVMLKWCEVEAHQFNPVASKLVYEVAIKPMLGQAADPAVVEENEDKLAKVMDVYESRLSESHYLGGDSFTLADLNHYPALFYLTSEKTKYKGFRYQVSKLYEPHPHFGVWSAVVTSRRAMEKVENLQKKKLW